MAIKTKAELYITYELDWFERMVVKFREEVENILNNLEDRTTTYITQKGIPTVKVVSRKEDQLKIGISILKDLPAMFEALDNLRQKNAATKLEVRGGMSLNGMMEDDMEQQEK